MNIGFYVNSLSEDGKLKEIQYELEKNMAYISNASIFYNAIAPIPFNVSAGIFHVSDMWSFEGILIVDRIQNLVKARNIVNKFKCWYYYDKANQDNFIDILNHVHLANKVLANGEQMAKEYKRLINKEVDCIVDKYHDISRISLA